MIKLFRLQKIEIMMMNTRYHTNSYDKANQLVSSTTDGKVTHYAYDATGRLIKEADKSSQP